MAPQVDHQLVTIQTTTIIIAMQIRLDRHIKQLRQQRQRQQHRQRPPINII